MDSARQIYLKVKNNLSTYNIFRVFATLSGVIAVPHFLKKRLSSWEGTILVPDVIFSNSTEIMLAQSPISSRLMTALPAPVCACKLSMGLKYFL